MTAADTYSDLLSLDRAVITTRDAAARIKTSTPEAIRRLRRMEEAGLVFHVRRGLWSLDPALETFALAPFLTSPFPAYVSFWSALHRHGMIEQIPRLISVASLDRPRRIKTAIGEFEVHQLKPEVFGGYEGSREEGLVATAEKALFDTIYVRCAAGGKAFFPELEIPEKFQLKVVKMWTARIESPRLRTLVKNRFEDVVGDPLPGPTPE